MQHEHSHIEGHGFEPTLAMSIFKIIPIENEEGMARRCNLGTIGIVNDWLMK